MWRVFWYTCVANFRPRRRNSITIAIAQTVCMVYYVLLLMLSRGVVACMYLRDVAIVRSHSDVVLLMDGVVGRDDQRPAFIRHGLYDDGGNAVGCLRIYMIDE